MSTELDRRRHLSTGTVVVSLIAAVTGVWAGDALASQPTIAARVGDQELSARVAAIVERVSRRSGARARPAAANQDRTMAELVTLVRAAIRHGDNRPWYRYSGAPLEAACSTADPILQYQLLVLLSI